MKKLLTVLFLSVTLLLTFSSCKKKVETAPKPEPVVQKVEEPAPQMEQPVLSEEEILMRKSLEEINREGHLQMVHFEFDKYQITDDMKPRLQQNADWLLKFSNIEILVEGHCDERGTEEYNLALGEKRAQTAKAYLVSLGVPEGRVQTVSYGKSRPLVQGNDENSHYQNRRAEFKVTKK